jgi:hypothetical protein
MGSARTTRDDAITAAFALAPRAAMGDEASAAAYAKGQGCGSPTRCSKRETFWTTHGRKSRLKGVRAQM